MATVRNSGESALFVATRSGRSDGSVGPYFELNDSKTLMVSFRMFRLGAYSLYANHAVVAVRRLEAGGELTQEVDLGFPIHETIPPYGPLGSQRYIQRQDVSGVIVIFGALPVEENVESLLRKKPKPYWTSGQDEIKAGKYAGNTLLDIQECLSSSTIDVDR